MKINLALDGSCLLPALLLFALGAYLSYQGYQTVLFFLELARRGQSTLGRVIGLQRYITHGQHSVEHTHPLFSYQVDGQWYEAQAEDGLFGESFRIGQEMVVRFLPENPKKFTWRRTSLLGIGSLLSGLSLMTLASWALLMIAEVL